MGRPPVGATMGRATRRGDLRSPTHGRRSPRSVGATMGRPPVGATMGRPPVGATMGRATRRGDLRSPTHGRRSPRSVGDRPWGDRRSPLRGRPSVRSVGATCGRPHTEGGARDPWATAHGATAGRPYAEGGACDPGATCGRSALALPCLRKTAPRPASRGNTRSLVPIKHRPHDFGFASARSPIDSSARVRLRADRDVFRDDLHAEPCLSVWRGHGRQDACERHGPTRAGRMVADGNHAPTRVPGATAGRPYTEGGARDP
jgi:hypothetical protein